MADERLYQHDYTDDLNLDASIGLDRSDYPRKKRTTLLVLFGWIKNWLFGSSLTSGKVLSNDGTNLVWIDAASGGSGYLPGDHILQGYIQTGGTHMSFRPFAEDRNDEPKFYDDDADPTGTDLIKLGAYLMATKLFGATGIHAGTKTSEHTGMLSSGGSYAAPIHRITSNTTLGWGHHSVVVDLESGSKTVTLPQATACKGRIYHIRVINSGSHTFSLAPHTGERIDDSATLIAITTEQWLILQSEGPVDGMGTEDGIVYGNWRILAKGLIS